MFNYQRAHNTHASQSTKTDNYIKCMPKSPQGGKLNSSKSNVYHNAEEKKSGRRQAELIPEQVPKLMQMCVIYALNCYFQ